MKVDKMLAFIIACLFLPIEIYSIGLLDLSPSIFICAAGAALIFASRPRFYEIFFMLLILILWTALYLIYSLNSGEFQIYQVGSFAYMILPLFSFYFAKAIRKFTSSNFPIHFIRYYSFLSSIFITYILFSIIRSGNEVRVGGSAIVKNSALEGDKIGFPDTPFTLYGSWGIHSFIDLLVINVIIILYSTFFTRNSKMGLPINIIGLLCTTYIIMQSFSKEAWLALLIAAIALIFRSMNRLPIHSTAAFFAASLGSILFFNSVSDTFIIQRQVKIFSTGDIDAISSGRINIVSQGINSVMNNPITGSIIDRSTYLDNINSSLHNQILTYIYKLGFIVGTTTLFHVAMLIYIGPFIIYRNYQTHKPLLIYLVIVVLSMSFFWDILLVNLIGSLIFFIFGMTSVSQNEHKKAKID